MFSKIFYLFVIIFVVLGLFLTNLLDGEYQNDIYYFIIKTFYSDFSFWVFFIVVNVITTIIIVSVYQFWFWTTLIEKFPERFIS